MLFQLKFGAFFLDCGKGGFSIHLMVNLCVFYHPLELAREGGVKQNVVKE